MSGIDSVGSEGPRHAYSGRIYLTVIKRFVSAFNRQNDRSAVRVIRPDISYSSKREWRRKKKDDSDNGSSISDSYKHIPFVRDEIQYINRTKVRFGGRTKVFVLLYRTGDLFGR